MPLHYSTFWEQCAHTMALGPDCIAISSAQRPHSCGVVRSVGDPGRLPGRLGSRTKAASSLPLVRKWRVGKLAGRFTFPSFSQRARKGWDTNAMGKAIGKQLSPAHTRVQIFLDTHISYLLASIRGRRLREIHRQIQLSRYWSCVQVRPDEQSLDLGWIFVFSRFLTPRSLKLNGCDQGWQ